MIDLICEMIAIFTMTGIKWKIDSATSMWSEDT